MVRIVFYNQNQVKFTGDSVEKRPLSGSESMLVYMARQMKRLNQQVKLYTGYPSKKVDNDLRSITKSNWYWTIATNLRYRLKPLPSTTWWFDKVHKNFDHWLAHNIENTDILDALSGVGLKSGRKLIQEGKSWICNRGSTHILTQKQYVMKIIIAWIMRFFVIKMNLFI